MTTDNHLQITLTPFLLNYALNSALIETRPHGRTKMKNKKCPICCVDCVDTAITCHSCGYAFSKTTRVWKKIINFSTVVSLFIGLLVVVINQSTQLIDRLRPTEFSSLGVMSAQGTNRLITENFALGISSGTGILLEKIKFIGNDNLSESLQIGFIHGKAYKSSDIATIRINPTALHLSYRPAPFEILSMLVNNGVKQSQISDLFKVRPTSDENVIYKKHPWAAIPGKVKIDYFEPVRDSTKRLSKEYPAQLLLWVRNPDNLKQRFEKQEYTNVDVDTVIEKYNSLIEKYTHDSSTRKPE